MSTDGRYVLGVSNGQTFEIDLQSGRHIPPTVGVFAAGQTLQSQDIAFGANLEFSYSYHFTSTNGAYTYGAIGNDHPYVVPGEQPYDYSQYYTGYDGDLFPVVTDNATGATSLLKGFGSNSYVEGAPIAASNNGDVVLTQNDVLNGIGDVDSGGLFYVSYVNAAPSLSINPINGVNFFGDDPGDSPVTISGLSDAIGQYVEVDFGAATSSNDPTSEYGTAAEAGTAQVKSDGSWSFTFDPQSAAVGPDGVFIEASVTGVEGSPARASQTAAIISTPPVVTSASASALNGETNVGAGDVVTIDLTVSTALTVDGAPKLDLSNGAVADFSRAFTSGDGFFFPLIHYIEFTYTPTLSDQGGPLSITGLDKSTGSIVDGADDLLAGPFNQNLGLTIQTAPTLSGDFASGSSGSFLNNGALTVYGSANVDHSGESITLFDGSTEVGASMLAYYGSPSPVSFTIASTTLAQGPHALAAITSIGPFASSNDESLASNALVVEIDTTPPSETVTGLTVSGDNHLSLSEQAASPLLAEVTLSAPLAEGVDGEPDDTIEIQLPSGVVAPLSVTPEDGSGEKFIVDLTQYASQFGVDGWLSAFVADGAGNQSQALTINFTSASQREITTVSATPASFQSSTGQLPSLSGNGSIVAFDAGDGASSMPGGSLTPGVYTEDLTMGAASITEVAPGGLDPSLSADGETLAYFGEANGSYGLYLQFLDSGPADSPGTLISQVGDYGFDRPSLSANGQTIAFSSAASDIVPGLATSDDQVYVAAVSGNNVSITVASAPDPNGDNGLVDASQGAGGPSFEASLAADGGSVAFVSEAANLLGQGDPRTSTLNSYTPQIYVKTLTDNAATGLKAGAVTLVSAAQGGNAVGDSYSSAPSLSGDGRYVVFESAADNLAPDNLARGESVPQYTQVIYIDDLKTGEIKLVSQTPGGNIADGYSSDAAISDDGGTVVFSSTADNLAGAAGEQLYAWNRATGHITLLSEPGAIAGNGSSEDASLSSDGTSVAFDSYATNLAAGQGTPSPYGAGQHIYVTSVPNLIAQKLTVTSAADSGIGSLRAELALAGGGDVINFDPTLAGDTIVLASTLAITEGVTIDGTGENITISGDHKITDFTVDDISTLAATIQGLTIANGSGQGTAGSDDGRIPGAGSAAAGGVDLRGGILNLAGDTFASNSAIGGAGGSNTDKGVGATGGAAAGAIYVESGATLAASDLTLNGNSATAGQAGKTSAKGAGADGASAAGAIYVDSHAIVSLANLSFDDNSARGAAGGAGDPNNSVSYVATGGDAAGAVYVVGGSTVTTGTLAFAGDAAVAGLNGVGKTDVNANAYADTNIVGQTGPASAGGSAQDGYIVGGTVVYENNSGPSTTSGRDGFFTLIGGSGPIELSGGTDSATGLAFTSVYTAPAGSAVLSALTTLLEAVVEARGDSSASGVATAQTLVETALDLPTGVDLASYNAEDALLSAAPGSFALAIAERVFAADSYLESTERLIDVAGGSRDEAIAGVAAELAAGQSVDLTDPASLISQGALTPEAAAAVLAVINATVNAVSAQLSQTTDPKTGFIDLTGGGIAIQAIAVDDFLQPGGDYTDAAAAYDSAIDGSDAAANPTLIGDATAAQNYAANSAPCYVKGTRILAERGEVAVEHLAIGDIVITASGQRKRVKWIGYRDLSCHAHPDPEKVWPVRILAGAVAPGVPKRELAVSPEHNVFLNGALFPAKLLVNGVSVVQEPVASVSYWHVELDNHALLVAEGLSAESFLDCRNRDAFANGGVVTALRADFTA